MDKFDKIVFKMEFGRIDITRGIIYVEKTNNCGGMSVMMIGRV